MGPRNVLRSNSAESTLNCGCRPSRLFTDRLPEVRCATEDGGVCVADAPSGRDEPEMPEPATDSASLRDAETEAGGQFSSSSASDEYGTISSKKASCRARRASQSSTGSSSADRGMSMVKVLDGPGGGGGLGTEGFVLSSVRYTRIRPRRFCPLTVSTA